MVGNNAVDDGAAPLPPSSVSSTSNLTPLSMGVPSARALQPVFQPPPPGQLLVAQATLTMGGYRRSLPVLYYTSIGGDSKYVYPFTRTLLGTAWHTQEHFDRCEFQFCPEPDSIRFCSRRTDLPAEMVHKLLIALEQNSSGAQLDLTKLQA